MFLHEAITELLQKEKRSMSSREIANALNESGLKVRKDGSLFNSTHIISNVNNHLDMFYTDSLYSPQRISLVED